MQPARSLLAALTLVQGLSLAALAADPPTALEKIAYYQRQIAEHPKHYPAYARLGQAWLDRARQTYDPAALAEARKALRQSLAIQPTYEALHTLAATANYSHQFEESLRWCAQAAEAAPQDKSILAMRVEALLALGRTDEARAAIGTVGESAGDFYTAASLAHWHASQGDRAAAAARFSEAAQLASAQQAKGLAVWATVSAAGIWLDGGDLPQAKPLLEAAVKLDAEDSFLKIHLAELAAAESRPGEALKIYEDLLKRQSDPELHRRAFLLARQLNDKAAPDSQLAAAEKLCRRAIDAGEAFGLETLANLYCDAGRGDEALRLAEQNLKHKQDAAAHETLARARRLVGGKP
ncbi:MAG TPA: hypothetical protein VFB80_09395 [Pirellulaceae bacterium]|nr:hypothetical protein [Pirellulaceae bacterium]